MSESASEYNVCPSFEVLKKRVVGTCIAVAVLSLTVGYWAGVGSTLNITREADGGVPSSEDSEPVEEDGDYKLAIVVRQDLKMSSGKVAAQCSHATLACYKSLQKSNPRALRKWERLGQTKVVLKCENEEELLGLEATAKSMNVCARSIQDAGRTQIAAGSRTVVGIGPGPARLVNQITGKLKLL